MALLQSNKRSRPLDDEENLYRVAAAQEAASLERPSLGGGDGYQDKNRGWEKTKRFLFGGESKPEMEEVGGQLIERPREEKRGFLKTAATYLLPAMFGGAPGLMTGFMLDQGARKDAKRAEAERYRKDKETALGFDLKNRELASDEAYRRGSLGLRQKEIGDESAYRQGMLGLKKQALGLDEDDTADASAFEALPPNAKSQLAGYNYTQLMALASNPEAPKTAAAAKYLLKKMKQDKVLSRVPYVME